MPAQQQTWPAQMGFMPRNLQFSLAWLMYAMLGAAVVMGAGRWVRTTFSADEVAGALLVAFTLAPLLLMTVVAVACRDCPAGVYQHLFGCLAIVVAVFTFDLQPYAGLPAVAGSLMILGGPVLAAHQAWTRNLPASGHTFEWRPSPASAVNGVGMVIWVSVVVVLLAIVVPPTPMNMQVVARRVHWVACSVPLFVGVALILSGPALALQESSTRNLPAGCHISAWLSAVNALGIAIFGVALVYMLATQGIP